MNDLLQNNFDQLSKIWSQIRLQLVRTFVIQATKNEVGIEKEAKRKCKMLVYNCSWVVDDVLSEIANLNPKEYPRLIILKICNVKVSATHGFVDGYKCQQIINILIKFCENRPLFLQLVSEDNQTVINYFKEENSVTFESEISNKKLDYFRDKSIEQLPMYGNFSMTIRYLWGSFIERDYLGSVALDVAKRGSKSDFLAALDAPFDEDGRILHPEAQRILFCLFEMDQQVNNPEVEPQDINLDESVATSSENSSNLDENESDDSHKYQSVLRTAVENGNKDIIDYLIAYWTPLVQQLPFEHKVKISTAAFETNQFDVLCDLLDISDFPFPSNFKTNGELVNHNRFMKILADRQELNAGIVEEDFDKINNFINGNLGLKTIYNTENKSTLEVALNLKKFSIFYYLKSLGLQGINCEDALSNLSDEEKKEAVKTAIEQRRKNVKDSMPNFHKSVLMLCSRSFVHNRKISKDQEIEYHKHIMKWFEVIYKVAPEMLDVAATCGHLKIIFDFESYSVENMTLASSQALGSMYSISKWIFVGAKLSDNKREQEIKGVLAHELCHYVMKLAYDNQESPYYKFKIDVIKIYEEIVKIIDKWSTTKSAEPDDECDGIVSLVFRCYMESDFHAELIVRIVQILAQFDDDPEKSNHLQEKYKNLFDFWRIHVIPDLQNYLLRNKEVVRLNGTVGLLPKIASKEIEFSNLRDIKITDKLTIITTNIAKLLLINIHKNLQEKDKNLLDTENFFMNPKKLKNIQNRKDFAEICSQNPNLNIFVDCTNVTDGLEHIIVNKSLNIIFIVRNEIQCEEVTQILSKIDTREPVKVNQNYSWHDLTKDCQKQLLQTKINFQNNRNISIWDLLLRKIDSNDPTSSKSTDSQDEAILDESSELVDDELLNLLIGEHQISINYKNIIEINDKNFEMLFQNRRLILKQNVTNPIQNSIDYITRSLRQYSEVNADISLPSEIGNNDSNEEPTKYVLISDIAGNG